MEKSNLRLVSTGKSLSANVCADLMLNLKTGSFKFSTKLPSELELAILFNVSRTVIRDALSHLEREGIVERVRGTGTVINRDVVNLNNRLDLKVEYESLIINLGYTPKVDCISFRIIESTTSIAQKLNINPSDKAILCKKRISASETPVIYSVDYIPLALFDDVNYEDIDWSSPIFNILEDYCGVFIHSSVAHVNAVICPHDVAMFLNVEKNSPVMLLDEVSVVRQGRPIMYSEAFYTDFFNFSVLRKKF